MESKTSWQQQKVHRRTQCFFAAGAIASLCLWTWIAFYSDYYSFGIFRIRNEFDVESCHYPSINPPKVDGSLWRLNRMRVVENLWSIINSSAVQSNAAIYIQGRAESVGNEAGVDFLQDSDFEYITGVLIKSAALVIEIPSGHATLYLDRQTDREIAFEGKYADFETIKAEHGLDLVQFKDTMNLRVFREIYALKPLPKQIDLSTAAIVDTLKLRSALNNARRKKSDWEIEMIRYATRIAASAHKELMNRASLQSSEFSLLALFRHLTFLCGCRVQAYAPIVGAHGNAAVLHYQGGQNETLSNEPIQSGLVLVDASGSYRGYASDVTRTFSTRPFTRDMRDIYSIVLASNKAGISMVKPGVKWRDITAHVQRVLLAGLQAAGYLDAYASDETLESSGVAGVFMPHGLGHTVGMDVHDVQPFLWQLQERDILTIEPGVYFNRPLFEQARQNPHKSPLINWEKVDRLLEENFGGVRIEDMVLVTADGYEVLSTDAPKELEQVSNLQ